MVLDSSWDMKSKIYYVFITFLIPIAQQSYIYIYSEYYTLIFNKMPKIIYILWRFWTTAHFQIIISLVILHALYMNHKSEKYICQDLKYILLNIIANMKMLICIKLTILSFIFFTWRVCLELWIIYVQ